MTLSARHARADDKELATRAKAGDRRAYNRLMERHGPRMLSIAWRTMGNRSDAEDAVQDAMAAAWFKLAQYDDKRSFGAWIGRIVLNKCRDHIRRRKFARLFDFGPNNRIEDLASAAPDGHERAQTKELLAAVDRAISGLPDKLREPFVLVTFDGRSQAEAADLLGVTEKAIETRIYRARQHLRKKLRKFEG